MVTVLSVLLHLASTSVSLHQSECSRAEQPARLFCLPQRPNSYDYCRPARITGYVRGTMSPLTYDGTSIYTAEPIAAASFEIPMGSVIEIEDYGVVRVADRGRLGSDGWVDIAVWSRAEALELTGVRRICVTYPRGG